ncbi:hypothetical protein [Streptomyces sp. Tu 3180]|uniref:hypothetical protein n=1 Tax=Streptomyces sp. Tu 3180 TaxID=2682611 RepID=UPI0013572F01|nr:hypothetical protein [Streptomyces sp. Tu 3180]KAF3463138.1 hypothetical protein GL259_02785 [Streptomyces sp. Tu 3180]
MVGEVRFQDGPQLLRVRVAQGDPVRLVSDRLGLIFTERDGDYRGVYHLAGTAGWAYRLVVARKAALLK